MSKLGTYDVILDILVSDPPEGPIQLAGRVPMAHMGQHGSPWVPEILFASHPWVPKSNSILFYVYFAVFAK